MFRIELRRSKRILEVLPDQTVLDVLLDNGIDVPFSCEQGLCGTCITVVLEGIPDHHDSVLSEEEQASNRYFTPCVSRSKSDVLVLDI